MTDARLPERWLNDRRLLRLSGDEFRSYVASLLWSVSNRTDGRLEPDDLALIPGFGRESVPAFEQSGLWASQSSGWQITDFTGTQTSSHELEVLENVRRNNRVAQARTRARKSDSQPDVSMTREPDDIGRQARPGRQGQEELCAREEDEEEPPGEPRPVPAPVTGETCGWCGNSGDCRCIGSEVSPAYSRRSA